VPRSLGGEEVSPIVFMQAIEELAKADASTAWCVAQTSVCSTIARSLKPQTGARIFKDDPRGVLAWGPSTSRPHAIAAPGGFRVTGEWPFASGSRHATWLAAHAVIYEPDSALRRDANGDPIQKTFVVPRHSATIKDVWHVIGLKGTGSDTYALTDVFVPDDCAIAHHALDPSEQHEHGPLYAFTIYQLFGSSFPAIALGLARATLDAFLDLARTKKPVASASLLRDSAVVQSQVGMAETQLAAARAFFFAAWDEIWQAAQADAMSLDQRVRLRMASINASQQSRQVVEMAYLAAGATAVFESNAFERRFRDMHAVSQQAQAQLSIYEVIGRHFLGLPLQTSRIF
jgi:alkylation response protein AidB-like acyl-CoA dehydrogenase